MCKLMDMTGQTFGRWTVLSRAGTGRWGEAFWLCRCVCGVERRVSGISLRNNRSTSCGCWNKDKAKTHGMTNTRIFNIWCGIKKRCNNKAHVHYKDYGGRGIKIYPEWEYDFKSFYDYVVKLPHFGENGYSLDRWPDKDGNYVPGNVRWTTQKEQCRNKRNTLMICGKPLIQVCEEKGLPYQTIWVRIKKYGWEIEKAISTPVKQYQHKRL